MKKILLVCSLFVVFSGLGYVASANTVVEPSYVTEVRNVIDKANDDILNLVLIAQEEALVLEKTFPKSEYNTQLKLLVEKLVNETNAIAQEAKDFAASNGVVVKCEYVKYEIGKKNVKIDPIIVVGWGHESHP